MKRAAGIDMFNQHHALQVTERFRANGRPLSIRFQHGQSDNPSSHHDDEEMLDALDIEPEASQADLSHQPPRLTHRHNKQDLAEEQISFIIFTRDNNKPDPYGQYSSTHRPLPWPAVAQAYNKVFRVDQHAIGSAAMEKRARTHREAWMAVRPEYPRNIVYAKKDAAPKSKSSRREKVEQVERITSTKKADTIGAAREIDHIATEVDTTARQLLNHVAERSTRVAGWVPPDYIRNHDLYDQVDEPDDNEHTSIEVCNGSNRSLGIVRVCTRDLVRSSGLAARLWSNALDIHDVRIGLPGASTMAVHQYAACISPNFTQLRDLCARGMDKSGTPYAWGFGALASLYNAATVLEDPNVRQLLLLQWQDFIDRGVKLELDLDALNSLFDTTTPGDPARSFWATALFSAGLYDETIHAGIFHRDLVMMLDLSSQSMVKVGRLRLQVET